MGNEQGTGYVVLDLRMTEAEKDIRSIDDKFERSIRSVNKRLENHIDKNDDEHKELRAGIAESNLIAREINIKMAQMVQNSDEMKKTFREATDEIKVDVKALGVKSDKQGGWQAIVYDLVKVILLIVGFIATGKFVL